MGRKGRWNKVKNRRYIYKKGDKIDDRLVLKFALDVPDFAL